MLQNLIEDCVLTHSNTNLVLAAQVIEKAVSFGVQEFVLCSGSRSSPLAGLLYHQKGLTVHCYPEERSASFFAIGAHKRTKRPVAVITTSGTAAAELLPAAMEGYYAGIALLLITADRPKNYRGTGAPQSPDQSGLFGKYAKTTVDMEEGDEWRSQGLICSSDCPTHWNICFSEPLPKKFPHLEFQPVNLPKSAPSSASLQDLERILNSFFQKCEYPLAIISQLPDDKREVVSEFVSKLGLPVYCEAPSGLREEFKLNHIRLKGEPCFKSAANKGYPVDGVLRIGGVPTCRLWRDLEKMSSKIALTSISHLPFTGITFGDFLQIDYEWLKRYPGKTKPYKFSSWLLADELRQESMLALFQKFPRAEPSLIHSLSKIIPESSLVFLGNSLPIREWDLAADFSTPHKNVYANRGMNGIDGQISTFLGLAGKGKKNFGLFGDLTALYDLAAPWIASELNFDRSVEKKDLHIIIINNGGGQIFKPIYEPVKFTNPHKLSFKPFADMWQLSYAKWDGEISEMAEVIEIIPDSYETALFNEQKEAFKAIE